MWNFSHQKSTTCSMGVFLLTPLLWLLSQHPTFVTKLTTQINLYFFSICLRFFSPLFHCYLSWLLEARKLSCSTHSIRSALKSALLHQSFSIQIVYAIYALISYFVHILYSLSPLPLTQLFSFKL